MIDQKLQKILARAGFGSRREIEKWIQAGRITVNHQTATLGMRIGTTDTVHIDNQKVSLSTAETIEETTQVLLYYKPEGEICSTNDPEGRPTVFHQLPSIHPLRWITVGRLDYNTSGLLLFTTNGLLSHRLLHPSYEIEREYAVRVYGKVTPSMLQTLKTGVLLDGQPSSFSHITQKPSTQGHNHWFHVILKEGKNRAVRRLWESQGVSVSRLIRIRFGPIKLPPTLKPGQFTYLTEKQIAQLSTAIASSTTKQIVR